MVYLVNSHTNATSKRWHLREIDLRFALNSTPGWYFDRFRLADLYRDRDQLMAALQRADGGSSGRFPWDRGIPRIEEGIYTHDQRENLLITRPA